MTVVSEHPTERAWSEHHASLTRFIRRRLSAPADVEDLLQTLFLRFHRHFGNGDGPQMPGAWLHQAARHALVDRYRAAHRNREQSVGVGEDLDALATTAPPADVERDSARPGQRCVRPLLDQLPDAYREALRLTDLGGITQDEAARRLGLSLPGMKARVQRGRRRLRAAFEACCELTMDGRGGIVSARPRPGSRSSCARPSSATGQRRCQEHEQAS